jgi:hypothetical protein
MNFDQVYRKKYEHLQHRINIFRIIIKYILPYPTYCRCGCTFLYTCSKFIVFDFKKNLCDTTFWHRGSIDTTMISLIINCSDTSDFCMHVMYDNTTTPTVHAMLALTSTILRGRIINSSWESIVALDMYFW